MTTRLSALHNLPDPVRSLLASTDRGDPVYCDATRYAEIITTTLSNCHSDSHRVSGVYKLRAAAEALYYRYNELSRNSLNNVRPYPQQP